MANQRRPDRESFQSARVGITRPPNTFSFFRYALIAFVFLVGGIYAAPNIYQPDPALQIKVSGSNSPDSALQARAERILTGAGLKVIASDTVSDSVLLRVDSDESQLRGRDTLLEALNSNSQQNHVVALTRASTTPGWLSSLGAKPMSLGLDLSGGVHFLLQVDMKKFVSDRVDRESEDMREMLVKNRIRYLGRNWLDDDQISIAFQAVEGRDQAAELLSDRFEGYDIAEAQIDNNPGLRLTISEDKIKELEDFAIDQNLQSLRNRVNELGVSEPIVQRLGRSRIVLDLPGIQDAARAKEIINKFANLEFRLEALPGSRSPQLETLNYEGVPVVLEKANIVTGSQVTNALQEYDPETGLPQVSITLDNEGGRRMNEVTKNHIGDSMAILFKELKTRTRRVVLDGEEELVPYTIETKRVINVATIQAALGFRFRITGLELNEARDLALLLRAGALAAPMYIVEERTVGASLGEENIDKGRTSILIGFSLVLLFMIVYYRWFGLAANIALTMNLVLIVAVMSVLGATLTLPGIAGIVLTVGMAVDANVLIFSRIREELRESSPQLAISSGFERALLPILDANITTFFVAIILFSIGSGPVKGFAVTLAVGIVTSMFTAILGTRALVNLIYGGRRLDRISI